ncbi:MAG: hypothetical protein HYY04_01525 [Chloroflexi bacterium]|nr:hypothetical protein [Chloroflexota bacterium]
MRDFTSVRQIDEYPFPDYLEDWRHGHLEAEVRRLHDLGYPASGGARWIFQTAWYLRSREQLFLDFQDNPEFADALISRVAGIRQQQAVRLAEAGIDVLGTTDDIGMQTGLVVHPNTWRRWIKPHLAALIAAAKRVNPRLIVGYHSDGQIQKVIPDLIEIGVDMWIY